jgi:hypothetical protein
VNGVDITREARAALDAWEALKKGRRLVLGAVVGLFEWGAGSRRRGPPVRRPGSAESFAWWILACVARQEHVDAWRKFPPRTRARVTDFLCMMGDEPGDAWDLAARLLERVAIVPERMDPDLQRAQAARMIRLLGEMPDAGKGSGGGDANG